MFRAVQLLPLFTGLIALYWSFKDRDGKGEKSLPVPVLFISMTAWALGCWAIKGIPPLTGLAAPLTLFAYFSCVAWIGSNNGPLSRIPPILLSIGGFCLFFASMTNSQPTHQAGASTLSAPWLISHVATTLAGIALFFLAFLKGCQILMSEKGPWFFLGSSGLSILCAWPGLLLGRALWLLLPLPAELSWIGGLGWALGFGLVTMTALCAGLYKRIPSDGESGIMTLITAGWLLYGAGGIIIGAAWASGAWGKAWSWDPKETMALCTFIYYGAGLISARFLGWQERDRRTASLAVLGFVLTSLTWFGVNLLSFTHHAY